VGQHLLLHLSWEVDDVDHAGAVLRDAQAACAADHADAGVGVSGNRTQRGNVVSQAGAAGAQAYCQHVALRCDSPNEGVVEQRTGADIPVGAVGEGIHVARHSDHTVATRERLGDDTVAGIAGRAENRDCRHCQPAPRQCDLRVRIYDRPSERSFRRRRLPEKP
jgi:hypothetical protein